MKQFLFIILFSIAMSDNASAQATAKPCSAAECSQFDFWLGDWDLTYNDTVHATNLVTKEMGGCLIHEHFNDPSHAYTGESWSVYNAKTKLWQQTWVDNQGAYIVLTGAFKDGSMILYTEPTLQPDGKMKQSRMVFYDITPDRFMWDWESTIDEGKTWTNNWRIHYKRRS